jgi:hypothetical protein
MKPVRTRWRIFRSGRIVGGSPSRLPHIFTTGIVLQVGANPVINIALEVGQVSETVEVQADAALVETRSNGVGQVMDNVRVMELPLNGRQVTELITLSGGRRRRRRSKLTA